MKITKGIWLNVLFWIYIVILFRITVFRSDFSLANFMQNGAINLTLFQEYIPLVEEGRWFQFLYLFVGNIVWFVPFGGALLISGKVSQKWKAAVLGLGLSFIIETMQYIFGTGISELDDLVLNALGVWIGAAMVQLYQQYRCHLDRGYKGGNDS